MAIRRGRTRQILAFALLTILLTFTLLPVAMTVVSSQKSNAEIYKSFWAPPESFRPEYYTKAFGFIYRYIWNSLVVCVASIWKRPFQQCSMRWMA